jgi:hypothetical protein
LFYFLARVLALLTGNVQEAGAAFMERRDPVWKPL